MIRLSICQDCGIEFYNGVTFDRCYVCHVRSLVGRRR